MKYDIDMNGEFQKIFKKLENIILSFPNIIVKKNAHQTSYSDEYKIVVMLRSNNDNTCFVSSWGQGIALQKLYSNMKGCGKIVRHLEFKCVKDINEEQIKDMIKESMILNMEYYELKNLTKRIKR